MPSSWGRLSVTWVTPADRPRAFGVYGSLPPAAVAAALDACPDAACVILTRPHL